MKALDIKKRREELHLTQEQLASKMGVSKNTILNYEKGKVIPDSKLHLLNSILYGDNHNNELNEPQNYYGVTVKNPNERTNQILEKLEEVETIIELSKKNNNKQELLHYTQIEKLLKKQLELIANADKEIEEDEEILKRLDNEEEK